MVFSSFEFIFQFLPVFLTVYFISPGRWKNVCLFTGSLVFYYYGVRDTPLFLGLLILSVLVNFRVGALIGRRKKSLVRKRWLICGICYNLLWLVVFKYAGFLAQNLNLILKLAGLSAAVPVYESALPVGISFYTFQSISYLLDVYRKDADFEHSFVGFGMYISMFPQLIAGPIVTYTSICRQIAEREHRLDKVEDGLRQFTIGLGLKVLLANRLGGLWNEVGAIGYESISTPFAWLGLAAFSFQIYFDFYGYSLMAKGLGQMMGFELPDNFNHPYMAVSMTEFWRRWHMTLGGWFREYVYIPLGGNRGGKLMTVRNMFIVWFLTGFWHGASWNFILWGMVLFMILSAEKLGYIRFLEKWRVAGHIYMLFVIPLSWLLFAVTDFRQILIYIQRLFPFLAEPDRFSYFPGDYIKYGKLYGISLAAGLVFITELPMKLYEKYRNTLATALFLLVVFWLCIHCMKIGLDDPFLYFRF